MRIARGRLSEQSDIKRQVSVPPQKTPVLKLEDNSKMQAEPHAIKHRVVSNRKYQKLKC